MNPHQTTTHSGVLSGKHIALIHYWYLRRRGGERVLDVLAEMYPNADIFIMLADKSGMLPSTAAHKITTSFLQKIPGAKRHYRSMMALYTTWRSSSLTCAATTS